MNTRENIQETSPTDYRMANIRYWHSRHNDWLRALNFYKDEIGILDNRLTEIAGKNTGAEMAAQLEHFQNQFVLHRNNIDELRHSIIVSLDRLAIEATNKDGYVSVLLLDAFERNEYQFLAEEKEISQLRQEFNSYSAEWM